MDRNEIHLMCRGEFKGVEVLSCVPPHKTRVSERDRDG